MIALQSLNTATVPMDNSFAPDGSDEHEDVHGDESGTLLNQSVPPESAQKKNKRTLILALPALILW